MQTTSCTWPYVVPVGEDPAAHGHWCAFTDLCHAMPPPRARAAEGGPHTHLRQQITIEETCEDVLPECSHPPMWGRHCVH